MAAQLARAAFVRRVVLPLSAAIMTANVVGAAVVFVFLAWVLPLPDVPDRLDARRWNGITVGVFLAVAMPVGFLWSYHRVRHVVHWLRSERPPEPGEQTRTLRAPVRLLVVQATLWTIGAALFLALNLQYSTRLAVDVAITILLGGAVTCSLGYLLAERILRPVTELALAQSVPDHPALPGIRARVLLAWALGTGAPVLGMFLIGGAEVVGISDESADRIAAAIVFLGAIALTVGLAGMVLTARSVADPVERVRHAMAEVARGRTDVEVPVGDGSEIGLLQAGFNRMVDGLREREELRDMFGRQVGKDVARQALERGVELGGEEREVAVLFVDLVGSTRLATECPPSEVVALLNDFFGAVVEAVGEHGGSINKFEGDAALCLFGAPLPSHAPADDALAAARTLRDRLRERLPQADFGIGVSAGSAVAGNIGAAERFEYTVIGDPVNEAARLTELAKSDDGRVLASGAALELAQDGERRCWEDGDRVELRGRSTETLLARPRRTG
jgi:adenylate cyclase